MCFLFNVGGFWIAAAFYHGGAGLGNGLGPLAQKEASSQRTRLLGAANTGQRGHVQRQKMIQAHCAAGRLKIGLPFCGGMSRA